MMALAYLLLAVWIAAPVLLWIGWLMVSALKRAEIAGKLTLTARRIGYPLYIAAYGLDIFTNLFVLGVYSLELPREFTVSARLQRWIRSDYGRRTAFAAWAADNLIDPFYWEPSKYHIRPSN